MVIDAHYCCLLPIQLDKLVYQAAKPVDARTRPTSILKKVFRPLMALRGAFTGYAAGEEMEMGHHAWLVAASFRAAANSPRGRHSVLMTLNISCQSASDT